MHFTTESSYLQSLTVAVSRQKEDPPADQNLQAGFSIAFATSTVSRPPAQLPRMDMIVTAWQETPYNKNSPLPARKQANLKPLTPNGQGF